MNKTAGCAQRQVSSMYMSNMLRLDRGCWSLTGLYTLCLCQIISWENTCLHSNNCIGCIESLKIIIICLLLKQMFKCLCTQVKYTLVMLNAI